MKKIITLLILLVSFTASAQLYQSMPQRGYGPVKAFWVDSVLIIPTNLTSGTNLSGGRQVGKIRYDMTDSAVKVWTGYQWRNWAGAGIDSSKVRVLDAVSDIASFSNSLVDNLIIKDTIRGGTFGRYSGSDAADDGMIFTDANGDKWLRVTTDDKINARWYGAGAAATGAQNFAYFTAAKNYIWLHPQSYSTLYIPADITGTGIYSVTGTLLFTQSIKIEGDGVIYKPTTKLRFAWNTTGIAIHTYNSVFNCEMKNLEIDNANAGTPIDSSKALIDIHCQVKLDNIYVSFASGAGINIEASLTGDSSSNPIYGDVSFSVIKNCKVSEALHGFRISGSDANHISFYNCEARTNKRWGILDDGFLGNEFYSCQFDANANAASSGTATTVSYGGGYYYATALHDDGSGIGKRPDLNPTYWYTTTAQAATAWDTTVHYWSGGQFTTIGASATSEWYSPYCESDQPMSVINTRSSVFGGLIGFGLTGGGHYYVDQGVIELHDNVHINTGLAIADATYPTVSLQIKDATPIQVIIESSGATSSIQLKNSGASFGGIGYNNTDMYFATSASYQLLLNSSQLEPTTNNTLNLGGSSNYWKDVYGTTYHGSGANITGVIHPADTTAQWVTDILRTPGVDSFYYRKGGILYGIKDSTGGGASGITVGTTTITGGTDKKIPFNNAGVYGESTLYYPSPGVLKIEDGTNAILKFTKPSTVNSSWWLVNGVNGNGFGYYSENYNLWRFLLNEDGSFALGGNALAPPATLNGTPGGNLGVGVTAPASTLEVNGSFATAYVDKSANYTATGSDCTINFTANTDTLTLPTAVGIKGREYTIINSTVGNSLVNTTSAQTIGNFVTATSYLLATGKSVTVISDNSNWKIKMSN